MSHTTFGYTKNRLGFEPDREERRMTHYAGVSTYTANGHPLNGPPANGHYEVDTMTGGVYEENLSKFKDERDAIQKKTFTKWVNKHLKKAGRHVRDLFEDLRDGHNLLSLLEVLSGEILPRERGRMRFHAIQNVETALRFLRYKEIKLVNIRGEDIVDGNPKLTLGLIWTIILHFQISDIVVGQEDLSAKEALLRWAQKTTHKYPGVSVENFTQSWRDGLAFNAIIHRNRPDLVDWKQVERRAVRERIDLAFHVMDREYGVTRLLDPEDVDTPEPDEKSIITYVSQLYDVFPEPPPGHPLFDADAQRKFEQLKELSSSLHQWIREHITIMQDRNFPNTLIEMRRLAEESNQFRVAQVPPKLHDKEKVMAAFRDLERQMRDANFEMDRDLHPDNIERSWSQLMMLFQERDQLILEEIARLEKLQRLAEKIHQEAKVTDSKLDDIEAWIEDEAKRIDHLHPKDAKNNCDQIERELARAEETIKSMFSDVQILRDNRYSQAQDLHRSVGLAYDKWAAVSSSLRQKLLIPMGDGETVQEIGDGGVVVRVEADGPKTRTVITMGGAVDYNTNNFRFIQECMDWVTNKLKQLKEGDYGTDMQTVKVEYERHQKEHKIIDQFQGNVEKCREAEVKFHGDELKIYGERMTILQKAYNELLVLSNKRVSDLHSLHDFMSAAHAELTWLNEREDKEVGRDWADKNLNLTHVEQYYEQLMSELEKRETQFSNVQDRGESLIIAHHPASQVIEAHMAAMQGKWAWLLQLTLCLETHLKHTVTSQRFFHECQVAEEWMTVKEETLNNHFAQADFKLEDGENLLKEMQQLREELATYEDEVQRLIENAQDIIPLRQRRERLRQPIEAVAICKYTYKEITITKDEVITIKDNSNKSAWKLTTSRGQQGEAPGVMFLLPPPDQEAIDTAEKLKRHYDRVITLWQKKHLRMRQNMIFATIKVVKSWDFQQFMSMDKETRTNIRRALNEDAEKLIQEGEPNDPQLRRLEREIAEVNRLFDEWERRAAMEDEKRNATKLFTDQCDSLSMTLSEYEKTIIKVCKAPLPRDVELLQTLVISHKEFESDLQGQEPAVNNVKSLFNNIPQKTPKEQAKLDKVLDQWERIWNYSTFYVERLKSVEITLTGLEEVTTVVTEFEMKLASYDSMPSDMDNLRKAHDDLMTLEADIQEKQALIDQLQEDVKHVRPTVEKTRPNTTKNPDVDRLEEDVNRMSKRWGNCCMQVVERLRSCEAACELLEKYNMSYQTETNWMDELDSKLRNLEELEAARAKEAWEKHVPLYEEARERSPRMEAVNTTGGRYVREAKIYDLRLTRYKCELEEDHPSLDGCVKRAQAQPGADTISQQLDLFNLKYQRQCEDLQSRMKEIGDQNSDDPELQNKLVGLLLAPLGVVRTFREFIGTDGEASRAPSQSQTSGAIQDTQPTKPKNDSEEFGEAAGNSSLEEAKTSVALVTITNKEGAQNGASIVVGNGNSTLSEDSVVDAALVYSAGSNTLEFNQIRTGKRIELASAGISTNPISLSPKGVVDPITGDQLSLDEAIRCGLIDTSKGEFVDPKTGRRYSFGEAVAKGLIDPQLAETLSDSCGVFDPKTGRQLTLLEAISSGLFDPKTKSFVDPKTGLPVSVEEAIKLGFILQAKVSELFPTMGPPKQSEKLCLVDTIQRGFVDVKTGQFLDDKGNNVTLSRAISQGLIDVEPDPSSGVSLSDALKQGLVLKDLGHIVDRNSGNAFSIPEAIERGLLNPNKKEVYNDESGYKISLTNALSSGVIDANSGKYVGKNSLQSLDDALKNHMIGTPLTLKEAYDLQMVDEDNSFRDPITNESVSLLTAIGRGITDYELKSVRDVKEGAYISLGEALGKSIIKPEGTFHDTLTGEDMSLGEAVKKGFLTSVSQKSIFEIEGIKNPSSGDYLSFNEALEQGIIDKSNGTFLDKKTMTRMILQEAADKDFIQPQLLEMLERPVGISVLGNELSLIQAVMNKRLDPMSGLLIDQSTRATVPLEIAVQKDMITPMGAAVLKSLLNITVTTATVTQTVKRTIKVSSNVESEEGAITFQDALRRGLIDDSTGMFTDPETGKEIALDEAINLGMIKIGTTSFRGSTSVMAARKSSSQSSRKSSVDVSRKSTTECSRKSSTEASRKSSIEMNRKSSAEMSRKSSADLTRRSCTDVSRRSPVDVSRKSSGDASRKSSGEYSRKSSTSSSRSTSPPKSLASAKEFLKESSSRASSRSSSLTTSLKMSTHTENVSQSQNNVTSEKSASRPSSRIISNGGTPEKQGSRPISRSSTQSFSPAMQNSPQKSPANGSPPRQSSPGKKIPFNRHDSFEKRMEERIETHTDDSKMDYSFRTESQAASSAIHIPIEREEISSPEPKGKSYEVPENGFTLKEAIEEELFNPICGLFKIPGTDRETSFKECLELNIINPFSATVLHREHKYSLKRAIENNILNATGHYTSSNQSITMKEAIDLGLIYFETYREVELKATLSRQALTEANNSSASSVDQISENISFDKSTGTYTVKSEMKSTELMTALKEGKINPSNITVSDPTTNTNVSMMEAFSKGLINRSTGEYTTGSKKMNILDAIKVGAVALVGAPIALAAAPIIGGKMALDKIRSGAKLAKDELENEMISVETETMRGGTIHARIVESGVTTTKISSFMVEVPGTGEEITLEEAVKRGLVSEETASQYKEEITTDKSTTSVVVLIIDPSTGEEIPAEEAIRRGIVTQDDVDEFLRMKEDQNKTNLSTYGSVSSLHRPSSPVNRPGSLSSRPGSVSSYRPGSPVSISRSSSRMTDRDQTAILHPILSSSASRASSADYSDIDEQRSTASQYSSSITVEMRQPTEDTFQSVREVESSTHSVRTKIINLKQGYALSSLDEVRNLQTGETMSIYEAKLRGIASDVQGNKEQNVTKQVKIFVSEAISKNLINFSSGVFTNPTSGATTTIADAIKSGLLITDFREQADEVETFIDFNADKISAGDAFIHLFDIEQKTFFRKTQNRSYTLNEAVEDDWINGEDIIFFVSSSSRMTIREAIHSQVLDGTTCDLKINDTNETMFIGDAARKGLIALFPQAAFEPERPRYTGRVFTLREAVDDGIYQTDTGLFFDMTTEEHISISEALKIGMIDYRSAEVRNTSSGVYQNIQIAVQTKIIHRQTCKVIDIEQHTEYNLLEAYEKGLIRDVVHSPEPKSPFDGISFWEAIERGQLNTETGLFFSAHEERKTMKLEEAIYRKYITKTSAFVIDTWKRKFCSLSEATRKNIIKDGLVMNTTSGKYMRIEEAIRSKLIIRSITKLTLIEILDFGLYQPYSGKITVPGGDGREITLSEAIDTHLVDHTKTIVKNTKSGRFVSTLEALHMGDIDGNTGMYVNMNLLEARSRGYLLPVDAMQAVQEKFRQANENLDNLNNWLDKVERDIAGQDVPSEDSDGLKNQINALKVIKDDVDEHNRPVNNTLDIITELVETGADVLSSAELNKLQSEGKQLKTRYDNVADNSDKLLKRVVSASEELTKFKGELSAFKNWMEKAYKVLEDKERQLANLNKVQGKTDDIKDFVSDVMTHGADLKFLSISGQKFVELTKDYVNYLNEFRMTLRQNKLKITESRVSEEVTHVSTDYHQLLARANSLADRFSKVGNKYKDYNDAVERAKKWLKETEPKVAKICNEPVGAEPKVVEDQLNRAKALNNEIIVNAKLIEDAKAAANNLLASLDDSQMSRDEKMAIEQTPVELQQRYDALRVMMGERCADLDAALVQSQGVQDALANIAGWLDNAEKQLASIMKPASLIRDRLDEQIRQLKVLQSDVNNHEPSIQKMYQSAQQFIQNSSNVRETKKIEGKVKEVQKKFDGLVKTIQARELFFNEISVTLESFTSQVESFEVWYMETIDILESRELLAMDADESANEIDKIVKRKEQMKPQFDEMIRNGKGLVGKKDVTDTAPCKDTIKELEEKWRELGDILGERQASNRARKQSLNAYEALREQVNMWLSKMERRIEELEPLAVDLDMLTKQITDLKPLVTEYTGYSKTIDKVNELGMQYDNILRGSFDNGSTSRRSSVSPRKPSLTPSLLSGTSRRPSASPKFGSGPSSPIRRESGVPMFQEASPIQSQLSEINNRYDMIGIRLGDRDRELANMKDELKKHLDLLKGLAAFIEKQERAFPGESIPSDKREADKQLKVLKGILDNLYENQGQLDTARVGIKDLLKKKPDAPGGEILEDNLNEISTRWKELQEKCKDRANILDELKDFHDIHDNLNNWLNSKGKLLNVLGPIASDPRLVQNQMSQIQVMKEEFNEKQPNKDRFNDIGENILENSGDSPDARKVEDKLDNINTKWDDLLGQLEERERALDAIAGPTRDFLNLSNKLSDNLSKISDDLDDVALSKADVEQKIKVLEGVGQNLGNQRPLLSEVMAVGEQLQEILTDPASKSEIKGKMNHVERQFNNCQKKLDNALAELENSNREAREFAEQCAAAADWLADMEGLLSEKVAISADQNVLSGQVKEFEPIYQEVMSKEHEIIMIINHGKDIIAKLPKSEAADQKRTLDALDKSWQKVKKIAGDRQSRLNTAFEHCKKFYSVQQKFLPWLDKAESTLERMEPISFVLNEIKKQEKELQAFRNDVNRHSSEYDTNNNSGETFVSACDTDKEIVKEELGHMKERWDHLNYFIAERAQAIADVLSKLTDFNENARDLSNGLQRAEDKLKQADGAPKDPRLLDKIKGLLEEAKDLEKGFGKVQQGGEDLLNDADHIGSDGTPIADTVNGLGERLGNLRDRLEDKAEDLKNAGAAVGEFNEKAKDIGNALAMLDDELNKMGPIAREINILNKQKDEVLSFLQRLDKKNDLVLEAVEDSKRLIADGVVPNPRELQEVVAGLQRSVDKLKKRGVSREKEVDDMIVKVTAFYDHYSGVMDDIQEVIREEKNLGAVAGDTETIKHQQEQFKQFQATVVSSVGKEVANSNRGGQGLIQSAASGVNTSVMEKDLEKMNDLWNSLKNSLAERERKLDQGLLQSGKYGEALHGLLGWLDEMEDMMMNQKPPSSDYKVVKAQVQEQKFVQKLLNDRKGAIESLVKTGQEIAASADPAERRRIEGEIKELGDRYADLNQKSDDRMNLLGEAMKMAKEYADKLGPLEKWLDKSEKKIKEMETVPTEEDQIQQRIREHENLHDDIVSKQPSFDDLADIASALMQVVGDEDAQSLADKIEELTNRYANLVTNSENIAQLLQDSMAGLRSLVLAYEDLLAWMEDCESRLTNFKILSVNTEKLMEQMEQLHDVTEEIVKKQPDVDNVVAIGHELMKHITNEESLSLKDKLDSLQRKYNDLATKAADLLKNAQDMLPLVQNFHQCHNQLGDWMTGVEGILQSLDTYNLEDQESEIIRLEQDIMDNKPLLESINITGPQLSQMSPGEGAKTIEGLVVRDNKRFEAIAEQIQRRGERIRLAKAKSGEVLNDIDDLLNWFRDVEQQIREADPPSHEPEVIRVQLKEHKALNDDISSQKGRVRDVLANAKKVLRESAQTADTEQVREKMEDLKETMDTVISLSSDRLGVLEQALPLAVHFYETHGELNEWLDDIEKEVMNQLNPGMRPDQIAKQMEINRSLMQSVQDHKPVIDRLNKTGGALLRLIVEDDAYRVQDIIESDNQRYNNLKAELREKMQSLEDAMQECSQFTDQLDGMLNSLENTKDQLQNAEPISGHPEKIKEQIDDNNTIIDDLGKKEAAYEAVKKAAEDIIQKAPNKQDPAIKDIKKKLDKLCGLWNEIQDMTKDRGDSLEDALALAEKFWDELQQVMSNLKDLEDSLNSQEPPAVEPKAIEAQKAELHEIKRGIDGTKPNVDKCRQTGTDLMNMVGDPDKPELRRHLEDLDNAWGNITSMYAKREENLLDAMEKAMEFHDMLQSLLEFLARSEKKFDNLGAIGSDINTVKKQIEELKRFKEEVDPWMVKVEALNRQASDLTERTTPEQARAIKEPLADVNARWGDLNKSIVVRQKELEHALLRLGQFQHALNELLVWIERTDKNVDQLQPVYGDPQVIEVELAKLKVIVNDIQAHQSSVDTLNDAGRQIIETEKGSREASQTQGKLNELNSKWNNLLGKSEERQSELEDALREAQAFNQEIQDMLMWLNDVDTALSTSKPVGGLPETAKDQLDRFMEVFKELEGTGPKVEALLARGHEYLKKSKDGQATNLHNNLKTLKARWDNILNRANDKKIKLEIALKEATEFHDALQSFIEWLTHAEKHLANSKPVSRVIETILVQIEEHKEFQAEVSTQRETMLSLDKKGTHLKYFSQKQDVILIKNLLVSVQHRWEKVVSKSAERTRALDYGYKEAKEFHDSWEFMMGWLDDAHVRLDEMSKEVKNDPEKIKQQIMQHKNFQKELGEKQPMYDSTQKTGKNLIGKAPKTDEPVIKNMLTELKNKWVNLCALSVERQRKLEEALLFSGQFKDALKALMDWLCSMEKGLDDKMPVHGDLDTVIGLVEQHKNFEEELNSRTDQVEQLKQTAEELLKTAEKEDAIKITSQVTELTNKWENVWSLSKNKTKRLEDALKQAEELHKSVNMLLEWLSDAEMKLRFAGPLPEDEEEVLRQIAEHEKFMAELKEKEVDKDYTINLAQEILKKCHPDAVQVIKHWITIIQSRWDEVASWALQRFEKLQEHLKQLKEILALLDELMQWLLGKEAILTDLEQEPLPDDLNIIKELIVEHQGFMDGLTERQPEIDSVCKPMRPKSQAPSSRRASKAKGLGRETEDREGSPDLDPSRRQSRVSPDREGSPTKSRKSSALRPSEGDRDMSSPARDYPKPWLDFLYQQSGYPSRADSIGGFGSRRTSRASPGDRATPDRFGRGASRFQDRKGSRASVSQEGGIRNPRAKALWDKWRHVWMMAWERDRRLKDKLSYLEELEKVKNFNWDEWRKRFLKFHNNKKSRVTDLFRKLDEDGDGYCPRDEFIDGILKNKFPSSKLELNAVADKFDHGDGMIDWREFIAALRPDWEERGPLTDTQRIDDEIKRQVAQCTCRQKFKVFQVGEGKYRFGDSQKLRLVRILRSTVMVRVGGGWVALDEFLVKNDPCRAKGRTNVELREQFTLASGVSQSMTPFKTKERPSVADSPGSSVSGGPRNSMSAGPITKIKEKTERSIGMARPSVDYGGDDSFSRRTSTQGRSSLTPGSQPGSRPPSRHGSNVSLNDSEDGRRGSSARRTSSFRSGSRQSSLRPTPVGFGSGVPRKTSTPATNGGSRNRTPSNSSTDRTPLSNRMRSKSYITPRPSKMIKSTSESNIPVFVGCQSNNTTATSTPSRVNSKNSLVNSRPNSRNTSTTSMAGGPSGGPGMLKSRTPSSSSIPVPSNLMRTRTPSGSGSRIPRTGSGVGSGLRGSSQSQKTTSYSADGSRFTASSDLRSAVESHRSWQQSST